MAQEIKQGNIFGRIGTGLGKGLAEQIPKEIEHARKNAGIQDYIQQSHNRNPQENLAALHSIYGLKPEAAQQFFELQKMQQQGNAYRNASGGQAGQPGSTATGWNQPVQSAQQRQTPPQSSQGQSAVNRQPIPGSSSPGKQSLNTTKAGEYGGSQINNVNPTEQESLTYVPLTPEQTNAEISQLISDGLLPDQAVAKQASNEAARKARAKAFEDRNAQLAEREKKAVSNLEGHLSNVVGEDKSPLAVGKYKGIPNDLYDDMIASFKQTLADNPNASVDDVARDFAKRAEYLSIANGKLDTLANTTGAEALFGGDKVLTKLENYSKAFKATGNSKQYYNKLIEKFNLSPEAAASIAYPETQSLRSFVSSYRPTGIGKGGLAPDPTKLDSDARKAAIDLKSAIKDEDSILTAARKLSERDHNFDRRAFFHQLGQELEGDTFNARQRAEILEGEKDVISTWGDFSIMPWFRRSR